MEEIEQTYAHKAAEDGTEEEVRRKRPRAESPPVLLSATADTDTNAVTEEADPDSEEERSKMMRDTLRKMSKQQRERYSMFARSSFDRKTVKKIVHEVIVSSNEANASARPNISDEIAIAVGGLAKIFVAELVDQARRVRRETGFVGSLTEEHVREGYRRMQRDGRVEGACVSQPLLHIRSQAIAEPVTSLFVLESAFDL